VAVVDAGYRLAIDLGTCHTVAVVRRGDEPPRTLLFDGSPLLPSGVYVQGRDLYVGRDAERMSLLDPARFEPYPKRRVDEGTVLLGESEVPVVDVLAAVLRRVVAEAAQAGVSPSGTAVLTCPADWGPQRRAVLLAAAQAAGLGSGQGQAHLVDEPIAAATYCERVLGRQVAPGQCLAVFDFGGGTLDVTVVRRDQYGLRVLAVGGLDDLGGVDVDAALVGHLGQLVSLRTPEVWRRLSAPESPSELRDRRAFWGEIRSAKEMLSRAASAPIQVPGTEEALHLTREEVERVAGPLVDRAVDETRRVLQRAGVGTPQLAGILLVGGSSRIPLVASRLHARFGLPPTVPEQPELPVAYGALLVATGPAAPPTPAPTSGPGYPPAPISPGAVYSAAPVTPAGYPAAPVTPAGAPVGSPMSGAPASPATSGTGSVSFAAEAVSPPGGLPVPAPPGGYPAPAAGWPAPPATQPPKAPLAPRRKPWSATRTVLTLVAVLVVLAGAVTVAIRIGTVVTKKQGPLRTGTGGSGVDRGGAAGGGTLSQVGQAIGLTGTGTAAATSDGRIVYYADVTTNHTDVSAVPATGGAAKWKVSVPIEPTGVRLTVLGALLLVDGERSGTDGGKNVRAVLDLATGAVKWKGQWEDRLDVTFVGTDEIVETRGSKPATERIDLLTGRTKWSHPADGLIIIDERRVGAALAWPTPQNAATVPPPGDLRQLGESAFREGLATDVANVVELDDDTGKGSVLDPGSGKARVTADVPLDIENWLVYDGAVVGKASDKASPGRDTVQAYRLDTLAKTWGIPEPAGSSIELVRPCGQHLVCVALQASGGDKTITAYQVADGKQVWQAKGDFSLDAKWYVFGPNVILGDGPFTNLNEALVINSADGKLLRKLDTSPRQYTVVAGDGGKVAVTSVAVSGAGSTHWQVSAVDLASGARTSGVDIGNNLPKQVSLVGDVLTVVTAGHDLRIMKVPGGPSPSPALR
jgi:hypothetical protein